MGGKLATFQQTTLLAEPVSWHQRSAARLVTSELCIRRNIHSKAVSSIESISASERDGRRLDL